MNPLNTTTSTIGSLLSDLRSETTTLLRQEVALAKAELTEKATRAGKNTLAIATGGAVAYAGLIVLLLGIGQLLGRGVAAMGLDGEAAAWLGPVIVGSIAGLIGWSMLATAKKTLKAESLSLPETMGSLQDDKRWMKSKIQHAHPQ